MKNSILYRKTSLRPGFGTVGLRILLSLLLFAGGTAGCGSRTGPVFSVQEEAVPEPEEQKTSSDAAEEEREETAKGKESLPEKVQEEQPGLYVYVTGAVRNPGVYVLPEGSRIMDAAAAAGGLLKEADRDRINQAAEVRDGMMICFPTEEETASLEQESAVLISSGADPRFVREGTALEENEGGSAEKININTADAETLMTLNGIGKAKAEAVIAYREEHGGFRSIEEICEVSGIKESVFDRIRESITVD